MSDWEQLNEDNWERVLQDDIDMYKVVEVTWQEERSKWRWNVFSNDRWQAGYSGYNTAASAMTDADKWLQAQGIE